jgi:hypothetical protein
MAHRRLVAVDAVWALLFATAAVVVITYWRLPPEELYNVSEEGLASGLGRALVFVNYPAALVAIAVAWLAAERIGAWNARLAALVASGLCALAGVPGVVEAEDLDAKAVNVLPALGVAIAFVLSLRAPWRRVERLPLDPVRLVVGVAVAVASIPWIFAVLGFFAPGDVFLGEEIRPGGDGRPGRAVHLGDHEGLDGAILVLSALLLSRHLVDVAARRGRIGVGYVLGLMFTYGFAVALNDFWLEQVEKRGWASWGAPNVLRPSLTLGWLVLVLAAAAAAALLLRLEGPRRRA